MTDSLLQISGLSIGYRQSNSRVVPVARDISEHLAAGELVCLVGPNGAGKSTLLRTLAGMQPPLGGLVSLSGRDLHRMRKGELARSVSVVLTTKVGTGQLSGWELTSLGRMPFTNWSGALTAEDRGIVSTALFDADAVAFADRQVAELSDGERQKVMLARALAQQPRLMILDEITAFLDLPRRMEIMRTLRNLAHRQGKAILLSTHDLELALAMSDRLWILPKGGALISGAPEDLVLSGAFAQAFQSEGLHFDPMKGSFATGASILGEVRLMGTGLGAVWTRRALERLGFAVVEAKPGQTDLLTVSETQEGFCWQIFAEAGTERHHSVASLLGSSRFRRRT